MRVMYIQDFSSGGVLTSVSSRVNFSPLHIFMEDAEVARNQLIANASYFTTSEQVDTKILFVLFLLYLN